MKADTFDLLDGEEMNRKNPETFWMPSFADRCGLQPGEIVKLCFDYGPDMFSTRDWVEITHRVYGGYRGAMHSCGQRHGEEFEFEYRHILCINDDSFFSRLDSRLMCVVLWCRHFVRLMPYRSLGEFHAELEAYKAHVSKVLGSLAGEAVPLFELKTKVDHAASRAGQRSSLTAYFSAEGIIREIAELAGTAAAYRTIHARKTALCPVRLTRWLRASGRSARP